MDNLFPEPLSFLFLSLFHFPRTKYLMYKVYLKYVSPIQGAFIHGEH